MIEIHPSYTKAFEEYENTLLDLERRREALNEYEDDVIEAYESLLEANNQALDRDGK